MPQTEKAKQAGQQNQETQQNQEQNQSVSMEALAKLLEPLTETVAQLKADKEQVVASQAAAQETARQTQLNKDADIAGMLDNVDLSDSTTDDKYESMSKRQLVDIIAGAVETAMEANATQIKSDIGKSLSPDLAKIGNIEKVLMGIVGNMGVQESRSKHNDFDDYKEPISKIMGEVPGITFERAYLLAKSEAAGKTPPKSQIETEKPTDNVWSAQPAQGGALPSQNALQTIADRGRESREENAVTKSGTVGIRNIISAGFDRAIAAKE